jgi:hypothetical protein
MMNIEDIDYSTGPQITLACAKCHKGHGFKTETVFESMHQLANLEAAEVFSILHLGLPCPYGGNADVDIETIEATCAPDTIIEDWQEYAKYAIRFNEIIGELVNDLGLNWSADVTRFVALTAIDRAVYPGLDKLTSAEEIPATYRVLGDYCTVGESFYEYIACDIWDGLLHGVPEVEEYLGVYRVTVVHAKRLAIIGEDED